MSTPHPLPPLAPVGTAGNPYTSGFAPGTRLPAQARTRRTERVLLLVAGGLTLALCAAILLVFISGATGATGFLVGLALAPLPALLVVSTLVWLDRYEPEPPPFLAGLFAWGALVAAAISLLINTGATLVLSPVHGEEQAAVIVAVYVAPIVEEVAKGLGVLVAVLVRRRHFDGVLDGLVCAGFVAAGFAFTENILYFGRAFFDGSTAGGAPLALGGTLFVFVLRGLMSPFAHPLFTVMTGMAIGWAFSARRGGVLPLAAPVLGLTAAILLHMLWNFSVTQQPDDFYGAYLLFMMPAFVLLSFLAVGMRRREGDVLARTLPAYVQAGWIPPYDAPMLASLPGRRQARRWARRRLGPAGHRLMRNYQQAASELAFLRDRAYRLGPDAAFAGRERVLLGALRSAQAVLSPALAGSASPRARTGGPPPPWSPHPLDVRRPTAAGGVRRP